METLLEKIKNAINNDYLIYDIYFDKSKEILTILIENKNLEELITIDDCTKVSNIVNEILDQNDDQIKYLDVSSVGIKKPLRTIDHFANYIGDEIFIKLKKNSKTKLQSEINIIQDVKDNQVLIDGHLINLNEIKEANLINKEFND